MSDCKELCPTCKVAHCDRVHWQRRPTAPRPQPIAYPIEHGHAATYSNQLRVWHVWEIDIGGR